MTRDMYVYANQWQASECHLIAEAAYEKWIDVEPWSIQRYLLIWRQWFYGTLSTDAVLRLPGVKQIPVSGR